MVKRDPASPHARPHETHETSFGCSPVLSGNHAITTSARHDQLRDLARPEKHAAQKPIPTSTIRPQNSPLQPGFGFSSGVGAWVITGNFRATIGDL